MAGIPIGSASARDCELLAPVGGPSQLDAALRFGADAVYLACDRFGMRARADNFSLDEIPTVVKRVHACGTTVHVTLNTLMDARDIALLPTYCEALDDAGVDAFIISDLGAFAVACEHAPHVALHVSTQASVCNAEAARMWHDLGATRVVCAREMSIDDIATMRANTPSDLEIEAFVHGAMCVAYSGRCLLSAAMTGRSGNKGACAQSCRWSYALVEEQRPGEYFTVEEDVAGSYVLNSQDLCMVEHLDELAAAGVSSFKIEGRNKRAFYVATVVGAYRLAMDGGDVQAALRELHAISHRPYSTGFYFGRATQSPERDGYVKECVHVATVEDCTALPDGSWRVTAVCHNAFQSGDRLEAVQPHCASVDVQVSGLRWLAPADGGQPFVERPPLSLAEVRAQSIEQSVEVANRSKERYVFIADVPFEPGDYIRRRL